MIKPETISHWYTKTGQPAYGATLREARKQSLLPSVTSILQVIAKPGLEAWKQEQLLVAAMQCPIIGDEDVYSYKKHVVQKSREISQTATGLGTETHTAIERYLGGLNYSVRSEVKKSFDAAIEILKAEYDLSLALTEMTAYNKKYAGRVDLITYPKGTKRMAIVDFKTQNVKDKPTVYPEWRYQLAAYSKCNVTMAGEPMYIDIDCHLANIIISTNPDNPGAWYKPMGSEGKKWDDAKAAYKAFMAAYTLWCMEKNW